MVIIGVLLSQVIHFCFFFAEVSKEVEFKKEDVIGRAWFFCRAWREEFITFLLDF